ncbi:hypothetical protein [Streptomyces sp. NBC_01571]|uniref:hypothetical protein n=1 Tax=unclassified Streptomyces TaxID=2593676 RepID=UPI002257520E|nr:hypothetical protein [Streptomyces sp. NBC_01571]MCX4579361.1 hypothetical protein [Streptomyces sp. NBC_01571]
MLTHSVERGVLVLTLNDDPAGDSRDLLPQYISDLIHAHSPAPVVIVLSAAATAAVIAAVLHAHRMCSRLSVLMSVATPSAAARRAFEAQVTPHGPRLVVHARTETAIATAFATAA